VPWAADKAAKAAAPRARMEECMASEVEVEVEVEKSKANEEETEAAAEDEEAKRQRGYYNRCDANGGSTTDSAAVKTTEAASSANVGGQR